MDDLSELIEDDEHRSAVSSILEELSAAVDMAAEDAVALFKASCSPFLGKDDIGMESGVYAFTGQEEFSVSFMRQFKSDPEQDIFDLQIVLEFACEPNEENEAIRESFDREEPEIFEEERVLEEFFEKVFSSQTYAYLTGADNRFTVRVLLESI